jgi:putative ATP-binding cassette transporter
MSLGVLMQAAQAFQRLTSALSWPVDNVGEIARCGASAERVLALHEDMQHLDQDGTTAGAPGIAIRRGADAQLVIEDLCVAEPSGKVVLDSFSARIERGDRVLLTGDPAATGGLAKVLGGLWSWGSGRVLLPGDGAITFVPPRPLLPEGTLRDALYYPRTSAPHADAGLLRALQCAGLAWLAPRLDDVDNWEQSLPLRAQQQLGFARLLLQKPTWLLLEGATDAFDPRGERLMLEMLQRELPDTTLLTISAHSELAGLHHRRIELTRPAAPKYLFDGRRGNGADAHR